MFAESVFILYFFEAHYTIALPNELLFKILAEKKDLNFLHIV